jgi:c-di-GMP-binding flagellar brake protein YcgR
VTSQSEPPTKQRRFSRTSVDFPVTVIVPGGELVLAGAAIDLSAGGMRVAMPSDVPPGQTIVLRFTLPDSAHEILLRAKVVLSFFDAASKRYAHGIVFTQYAQPDQEAIAAYLTPN